MHQELTAVASILLGSGVASFIAKLIVGRSLQKIDELVHRLETVTNELIVIKIKIENLEKLKDLIFEHDRKIIDFEARVKRYGPSPGRPTKTSF